MSPHHLRKLKIASVWIAIVLAGIGAGAWRYQSSTEEVRVQFIRAASRAASRAAIAFDLQEVRRLTGDTDRPAYRIVTARLRKFHAVDPGVRSLYLFRFVPDSGKTVFLADSLAVRSERGTVGPLGAGRQINPEQVEEVVRTGLPALRGPMSDDTGSWLTLYVGIGDSAEGAVGSNGTILLGVDVDALAWRLSPLMGGFQAAFYVWILLGLPFVAWLVMRRQVEQREVIRNLSEAMEQSHSAIMILDLDSRIEYVNRGLVQQIGYSRSDLIGRKWQEFHVAQSADAPLSDLVATVRSGRPWDGEWSNRRNDGTVYPVRGVVTPVKHRDGSLSCFVAVFDDVTETKSREAELREARDLAQAGDRAKGQFLATMSHEVRTPLNGIVGFTSLLLETPLSSEQREYVQTIRMSTEALIQLTGDILDFARIESGKLKLDPAACDPRECIEDALDLLATKAVEKHIELLHRVDPGVPAAVVVDGARLRQVLANLIGNAVKFTDHGEVEVSVRRLPELPEPAWHQPPGEGTGPDPTAEQWSENARCTLEFAVRDTGIGIAREHHEKLFRPFTQVDESTTRRYGGTGLGLAICRNLVELMDGTIGVRSELGRGATFTFTVAATVAAATSPPRDLQRLRLALIMDLGPLRRELVGLVNGWNATPLEFDEPEEAAAGDWDTALVEVGEEAARKLAAVPPVPPLLPVDKTIGLVPISLSNDLRTGLRTRFRLLVNKPVHHDALYAVLVGSRSPMVPAPAITHFGFRVLLVEDNAINQRLMQRTLANLGCSAAVADNGARAIETLAQKAADFDLILLDLHMPEMDGLSALRAIRAGRAGQRAQTMWIIALTADARDQQRTRAVEAGVNDYLTKPIEPGELESALIRFRAERMTPRR